jgi:hypothetical protein
MRVAFEYDLNDLVDANVRAHSAVPAARRRLLATRALSALLFGSFGGCFGAAILPGTPDERVALGMTIAAVVGAVQWATYMRQLRHTWYRHFRAILGSDGPFSCEIELRPEGVWARQNDTQILHEWPSIVAIEETADSIDMRTRSGGYVVVRDRAFWSADEREKFLTTARQCREMYREADETPP